MQPVKALPPHFLALSCALVVWPVGSDVLGQTNPPGPIYHIYCGNTHSHSVYTWSHGGQYAKAIKETGDNKEPGVVVSKEGVQSPGKSQILRKDWQKIQGPPSQHFTMAKTNSYDFYAVTDHSQEAPLNPVSPTNAAWVATKREAAQASDSQFTALAGFEYSENNGPGGKGHIMYSAARNT